MLVQIGGYSLDASNLRRGNCFFSRRDSSMVSDVAVHIGFEGGEILDSKTNRRYKVDQTIQVQTQIFAFDIGKF